jgi:integrase/recombinase XerD
LTFRCGINFVRFAPFFQTEGTMRNKYLHKKTPNISPQKVDDALGDYPRQFGTERGGKTRAAKPTSEAVSRRKLIQDCVEYLRNERGLGERTVGGGFFNVIDCFLKFRFGNAISDLSKITQIDIVGFMQKMRSPEHPSRVTSAATHLRRFFRFLLKVGKIETNLALGVPSIARHGRERLPRHLPQEQVDALLAAVRSNTPRGRRNYAIMLLLARLGLRPPEVIAMQIDDIDWRAGEIIIRGKGQLHDRAPLPRDVGEALAAYIRLGRATKSRSLFVSSLAPHRPFKSAIVLNGILKEAYRKTGLKTPSPNVGSYVLRHSLATNLVRRGASLDEIANVLRHRSRTTTMRYAKLDIDGLRSIAKPWPVAGGAK